MLHRQETITKWIKGYDKNNIVKPFFYLDWDIENKMFPENSATWYHKIPTEKKIMWRSIIKIGYREVLLCSSFIPINTEFSSSVYDSFLQSHLQKAIRRKNKKAAVFTADLLLELNPLKLLRRLPIILIEDTFIHKSFSTLIWLMCALSIKNTNNGLNDNQKKWILGVVYIMSNGNIKEYIDHNNINFIFSNNIYEINKLNNKYIQDIIYCLETRRCYGGLKGDDYMLQSLEKKYIDIFSNNNDNPLWEKLFFKTIRPIILKKTKFKQNEWLMEGYDFHCQPTLLQRLEEEFPEYDYDEHKKTIWHKSSKINFRTVLNYDLKTKKYFQVNKEYIPENITNHWNKIRQSIRKKAWCYIQGMLENLKLMFPDWIDYKPYEPCINYLSFTSEENKDDEKNNNNNE